MRTFALILLIINAAAALVLYGFFFIGLGDGSVSEFNLGLWLLILIGMSALLASGWIFRAKGKSGVATILLLPLAIPATLYGLFVLLMLILQPRWN